MFKHTWNIQLHSIFICYYNSSDLIFSNQFQIWLPWGPPLPSQLFPFIFKGTTKEYLVVETPLDLTSTSLTCGIFGSSEPSVTQSFSGTGVTGLGDPTEEGPVWSPEPLVTKPFSGNGVTVTLQDLMLSQLKSLAYKHQLFI